MNSSGIASSAVLLAVVAVGAAAGVAVRPEGDFVPPLAAVHRQPPGPAQIELAEAAAPSVVSEVAEAAPKQGISLFGVDVASAVSGACSETMTTADVLVPDAVVCELMSQALKYIPDEATDLVPLLLGGKSPAP